MGLVEMEQDRETTYLGCGMDTRYDLAVREGEVGVDRFVMRVTDEEFDRHVDSLEGDGIDTREWTGPGHERGLTFDLPVSGATIGLVVVADNRYHHSAEASGFLDSAAPVDDERSAIAPTDVDHVALVTPDVEREARFLEAALDFRVSDAQIQDDDWRNAFVRYGLHHHDVALFAGDDENVLDHVAWATPDIFQLEQVADTLAQNGYQLSKPFTKHGPGANVAIYFYEPGGHRFEYNTGMSTVEPGCPEGIYEREDRKGGSSLWGAH